MSEVSIKTTPQGLPAKGILRRLLLAACLWAVVATAMSQPAAALTKLYGDGRQLHTGGNVCESFLPGSYRKLTVPAPSLSGFRLQLVNKIKVSPRVQYSYNLERPNWQP